jgi:hypothetical protein
MSSDDANDYLNEMVQGNPQNVNEFRIMTSTLEKTVKKIIYKKQSRKLGRYPMSTILRIQPSTRQCENAARILGTKKGNIAKGGGLFGKSNKQENANKVNFDSETLKDISIPLFSAKGLVLQRDNGEVHEFSFFNRIKFSFYDMFFLFCLMP